MLCLLVHTFSFFSLKFEPHVLSQSRLILSYHSSLAKAKPSAVRVSPGEEQGWAEGAPTAPVGSQADRAEGPEIAPEAVGVAGGSAAGITAGSAGPNDWLSFAVLAGWFPLKRSAALFTIFPLGRATHDPNAHNLPQRDQKKPAQGRLHLGNKGH